MTRGVVFFAHDNERIKYGLLAYWSALRVKKFLQAGSTLIAGQNTVDNLNASIPDWHRHFDKVIIQESTATQTKLSGNQGEKLVFHNLDRISAYELSPYDETIVMDSDLVIQTNSLSKLWGSNEDLIICDKSPNLSGIIDREFMLTSDKGIKFYWATVFYFRKSEFAENFFHVCKWVKKNYSWLSYIYELPSGPYRNDFVWSIAARHFNDSICTIPFNIFHSNYEDNILEINQEAIKILSGSTICKVKNDIHVLNKFDLQEHIEKELL